MFLVGHNRWDMPWVLCNHMYFFWFIQSSLSCEDLHHAGTPLPRHKDLQEIWILWLKELLYLIRCAIPNAVVLKNYFRRLRLVTVYSSFLLHLVFLSADRQKWWWQGWGRGRWYRWWWRGYGCSRGRNHIIIDMIMMHIYCSHVLIHKVKTQYLYKNHVS